MPTLSNNPFLADDESVLGNLVELENEQYAAQLTATWSGAFMLNGPKVLRSRADRMTLRVINSTGSATDSVEVDPVAWFALSPQEVGDTLTNNNALTISAGLTGGAIRVGRTADNRVLIDDAGFTTTHNAINVALDLAYYSGGVLTDKLTAFGGLQTRQAVYHSWTPSLAASTDPTGLTYDGTVLGVPANSGWRNVDVPLEVADKVNPTDVKVFAETTWTYDVNTGTWSHGVFTHYLANSTYTVQYAVPGTAVDGTWTSEPPSGLDFYLVRFRDNVGAWHYSTVGPEPRGWKTLVNEVFPTGGSAGPFTYDFDGGEYDWSEASLISISYQGQTAAGTYMQDKWTHIVNADDVKTCDTSATGRVANSLNVLLSSWQQAHNYGAGAQNADIQSLIGTRGQRVHINFEDTDTAAGETQVGNRVRVWRGYLDRGGRFIIRVYE